MKSQRLFIESYLKPKSEWEVMVPNFCKSNAVYSISIGTICDCNENKNFISYSIWYFKTNGDPNCGVSV